MSTRILNGKRQKSSQTEWMTSGVEHSRKEGTEIILDLFT